MSLEKLIQVLQDLLNQDSGVIEPIHLSGYLKGELYRNNKKIYEFQTKNIIVNAGKAEVAGLINGVTSGPFQYLAIGTGTVAPNATQTALDSEITTGGGERALATVSRVTTSVANDTAQWEHTWTFTQSFGITESGIFDASSGGNMLARQTFPVVNVQNGDSFKITWKVQVQ